MKFLNKTLAALSAIALALCFCGCQQQEIAKADAILTTEAILNLPGAGAEHVLTVCADGKWLADVTEDWLSISANSGEGTVDITVKVEENPGEARTAYIVFAGSSVAKEYKVTVNQKPNTYKNAPEVTVTELYTVNVSTPVKLKESQVVALTTKGMILTDGETNIYAIGKGAAIGDKVTLTGNTVSEQGIVVFVVDDIAVGANSEVVYPEAKDATDLVATDTYIIEKAQYVSLYGIFANPKLNVSGVNVQVLDPAVSLTAADYDNHYTIMKGYIVGSKEKGYTLVVTSIEDKGNVGKVYLRFEIETGAFASKYSSTFGSNPTVNAEEGNGYFKYVAELTPENNADGKFKMDISGNDPRCTGPWPGDYWLFYGEDPVKGGSELQVQFGTRTSATGHKYWLLEYLDGNVWKPIGEVKTSVDMTENVEYTHAMNADGATNVAVNEKFILSKNVDHLQIRFRCVANFQAKGGTLPTRNGGSARLAVKDAYQPLIMILKEGAGVETVLADIKTSVTHLSFEGSPAGTQTLTVTSDHAFTASSTAAWLKISPDSGLPGTATEITVECEASELSNLREASIHIVSADSELDIPVIQSAAGQTLKPLISVTNGSVRKEEGLGHIFKVEFQANTDYEVTTDVDWLTVVPATKALVVNGEASIRCSNNLTDSPRTGHVIIKNESLNLVAVVVVVQEVFNPIELELTKASGFAANYEFPAKVNLALSIASDSDWAVVGANIEAGAEFLPVTISANTTGASRQAKLTFTNAEFGLEKVITITQLAQGAEGSVFADNFNWMAPMIAFYNSKVPTKPIGKSVEENNASGIAPNAYTDVNIIESGLMAEFANQGYEDLNPSGKVLYPQDAYWKMGKTSVHTGLKLPYFYYVGDVTLSFDWCPHMTGSGNIDKVNVVVEVVGVGKVVTANGPASVSEPFVNNWEKKKLEWHGAQAKITGLKLGDRVIIRPAYMTDHDGITQMRWYIDNIKVFPTTD